MNVRTAEVLIELDAILKANTSIDIVHTAEKIASISSETSNVAAYISLTNALPKLQQQTEGIDGYDYHGFFVITLNTNCTADKFLVYDVVDSVQRSILNDNAVWNKLVDRDIVSVEFDNAEFYPRRVAAIIVEVRYRLTCT